MHDPKITLYSFLPSQNAVRPEIALHEKGVAFDKVALDLLQGEHKKPPLSDLTPRGQVPTVVFEAGDERIVVYESIATIRFIDDLFPEPALLPPVSSPKARAEALMRIEEFQAKLDPKNVFGSAMFGRRSRADLGKRVDDLLAEIPRWETYVRGSDFLAGETFTLADIAVFPLLMHFEALGYDYRGKTPALADYMDRCKERPSVKKTGWLEVLKDFVAGRDPLLVLAD